MRQEAEAPIRIPVDLTNPGQFFGCCGMLELANRLDPGAEAWFKYGEFLIATDKSEISLESLLNSAQEIKLIEEGELNNPEDDENGEGDDREKDVSTLIIESPIAIRLDWWKDKTLKTWAGSMNARKIFLAMCKAIDTQNKDPFNQGLVVSDADTSIKSSTKNKKPKKPKKREPFYFDSRRGASALAVDVGFSPDALKLTTIAYPAVEGLAMIGLQRFRPRPTDKLRIFEYSAWDTPLPVEVAPLATLGFIEGGNKYRFKNAFRTDQRKHKAFSPATLIRGD